jgi:hypothetical protein
MVTVAGDFKDVLIMFFRKFSTFKIEKNRTILDFKLDTHGQARGYLQASTAPVLSALGILLTLRLNLLFSIRQKSSRDACPHDSNNHVSSRNIV